ncbi:MAG: hypothetical protein EBR40_03075 [Proteobacteria bacterium]|nr:hypothetical protein [Pseudomonadota bacterium]
MDEKKQLSDSDKETLQNFYRASRDLLASGLVPPICVQRSFEAASAGFLGEDTWRPTHITAAAMVDAVEGRVSNIQRAHGVFGDRMDRYDRTLAILSGPEQSFDAWWTFYKEHDATVLITKEEHGSGKKFTVEELFELPKWEEGMFTNSGFSFKMRKKVELAWIRAKLEEMEKLREGR